MTPYVEAIRPETTLEQAADVIAEETHPQATGNGQGYK